MTEKGSKQDLGIPGDEGGKVCWRRSFVFKSMESPLEVEELVNKRHSEVDVSSTWACLGHVE